VSGVAIRARGKHRKRWFRRRPASRDGDLGLVLAAADEGMTIAELRAFLARAETASAAAGLDPAGVRLRVAVKHTGAVRAAWVKP